MFITLKTLLSIRASTLTNLFIYYIQKLPLIGKHVSDQTYAELGLKKGVAVFAFIIIMLWKLLLSFAYIGLLVYLPATQLGNSHTTTEQLQQFVHIFIMISLIVAGTSSATILEPKREKYIAVKLLKLSPRTYMLVTLSNRYVTFFIYLLPALYFYASSLQLSVLGIFQLALSATLWRIFTEYLHIKLYEKTGVVLIKKTAIVWTTIFIGFAVAYVPLLLDIVPLTAAILLHVIAYIFFILLGIFAIFKLGKYKHYRDAVDAATKVDDPLLNIGRMMSEAQKTSVESKVSDYNHNEINSNKLASKQGYHYLNAIFLSRHRSLIQKPIYISAAIIFIITIVATGLIIGLPDKRELFVTALDTIYPILFALMYFLTVGEKLCRAMFYNCDSSLLRYSFYRASAFQHFCIRLLHMIKVNVVISAALALALTVIKIVAGGEWWSMNILMMWTSIVLLSVFFSVHHLFMYYFFQPYATEVNLKNPMYFLINMIISGISGFSLFMRTSSVVFTSIVGIATLAYICLALIVVKKHGARTFRIK